MVFPNDNVPDPMPKAASHAMNCFPNQEGYTEFIKGRNTPTPFIPAEMRRDRIGYLIGAGPVCALAEGRLPVTVFQVFKGWRVS